VYQHAGFDAKLNEWCDESGGFHTIDWDKRDGFIYRSSRFDHRNQDGQLGFVSLIIDAVKPG
jgi:predicted SAM-dependent methyltransferase